MILFNHITHTFQNLKVNRSRNFLTILGIAIGASCISLVLALSQASKQLLKTDLANYKTEAILVRSLQPSVKQNRLLDLTINDWAAGSSLSKLDWVELKKLTQIESVTPIMPFVADLKAKNHSLQQQLIVGSGPDLVKTMNLELIKGQFISSDIVANAAVIGQNLATQLFSSNECVGQTFNLRGQNFLIVGVIKQTNYKAQTGGIDFNNVVIIGSNSAEQLTNHSVQIKQFNLLLKPKVNQQQALNNIKNSLDRTHLQENNFLLLKQDDYLNPSVNQRYVELGQTTLAIALIALLIGGIGVMNIMLVSVAEQTHEIGVRRSIGATARNIVSQFLIESSVLSLLGGLFGLGISYLLTLAFGATLPLVAQYDLIVIIQVLTTTLVIGILAGIIPAIRAASKNPIEALRQFN